MLERFNWCSYVSIAIGAHRANSFLYRASENFQTLFHWPKKQRQNSFRENSRESDCLKVVVDAKPQSADLSASEGKFDAFYASRERVLQDRWWGVGVGPCAI
jgi:hypothetical protein